MKSLNIAGLDFDTIKNNLIEFLKNDSKYTDWNFQGSGINALLNILAATAHYIGYYIKVMLAESFIDSATQKISLLSKAKLTAYIPKSMRSSRALVTLQIRLDENQDVESKSLIIPRGSFFSGNNSNSDSRNFYVLDDVLCSKRTIEDITNKIIYTSPEFLVYEGKIQTWRFVRDITILNQRYIIKDNNIDIDTIRVATYPDINSTSRTEYKFVDNIMDVNSISKVFYLSTNADGYYELFFGNNQFGQSISNNTIIEVTYISTTGESGNGCTKMIYQRPNVEIVSRQTTGSFSDFITTIVQTSSGGMLPETIDDLRFNIPHHFKRQNRIVTEDDYKSILLEKFRDIDSINVWGGERDYNRRYGSIFISIKPKYNKFLSTTAKKEIQNILSEYNVSGLPVIFRDPNYIRINLDVHVKFDRNLTNKSSGEISTLIYNKIVEYSNLYLDKFDNGLSDFSLLEYAKSVDPSITRIYNTKTLTQDKTLLYRSNIENLIFFGNKIKKGTFISTEFYYGNIKCILKDDEKGNVFIYKTTDNTLMLNTKVGTINYTTGIISLILNIDFVSVTDYGNSGLFSFTITPELPDIDTFQEAILSLENINVVV